MSRQSSQTGARAVDSNRGERRRRGGGSTSNSAPSQYASVQASSQIGQAPQITGQPGYGTGRAWEHTNPEAYRVVNDPHLNYTYQPAAPAPTQTYAHPSYDTAAFYAEQYYQQMNTYGSESYQNPSGSLTADQLRNLNNREQPVDNINVWQDEDQRNGSWYGRVEK